MTGDEDSHAILRALVVSHMQGPMDETLRSIYKERIELDKHYIGDWATNAEVFGAASLLSATINAFVEQFRTWQAFEMHHKDDEKNIYLKLSRNHFELIVSVV